MKPLLALLSLFAVGWVSLLPAHAGPLPQSRKDKAGTAPIVRKDNFCAAYGRGYVRVAGSSTCVKIGGRVEFETGVRRGQNNVRGR